MADDLPSAQAPTTPIVPVNATLAAAAVVQRLDVAAMHEEACGVM